MNTKIYHANRDGTVTILEDDRAGRPLPPRLDLFNHSPSGFAWGFMGSGPAQLALAILADATGDDAFAVRHHQDFKADIIATFQTDHAFAISQRKVLEIVELYKVRASTSTRAVENFPIT